MNYFSSISDKILSEVLSHLGRNTLPIAKQNNSNFTLFDGFAGVSLFYYNLYLFNKSDFYKSASLDAFRKSISLLNESPNISLSFGYGLTGLAWLANFYQKSSFIENHNDFLIETDNILCNKDLYTINRPYDPAYGIISYSYYFFSRNNSLSIMCIEKTIHYLDSTKIEIDGAYAWKTYHKLDIYPPEYNLGPAHGIPGILLFLAKCINMKIEWVKCTDLLEKGLDFLIKIYSDQQNNNTDKSSVFPMSVNDKKELLFCNYRWCYGDFGISIIFLKIEKLTKIKKAKLIANQLIHRLSKFHDLHMGKNIDSSFCHGSAGNAYMTMLLEQNTKTINFKPIMNYYLNELNTFYNKSTKLGFKSYQRDALSGNEYFNPNDISILTGTSGIGLSLIGILQSKPQTWDTFLNLS